MSTPAVSCLAVAEKSRVVVVMNSCKRKVLVVFTCLQKTSDLNLKPTLSQFVLILCLLWIFLGFPQVVKRCFRGTSGPKTQGS